jgi:hypothetical protein
VPVLRLATDDTLGSTLGNLGQALARNFNPLSQMQAYELQYRMWLQQQQLQQMQRENAAKAAAVQQWGHIVPPDKLPQFALMIYQGAPYEQVARAAAQLSGNLVDDPNAMQANIRYSSSLPASPTTTRRSGRPLLVRTPPSRPTIGKSSRRAQRRARPKAARSARPVGPTHP